MAAVTSRAATSSAWSARTSPAFMPSACASAHNLSISPSVNDRRWRAFAASDATSRVSAKTVSKVNLVAFIGPLPSINELIFALLAGDHDFALVGEILGDVDHAHLRFVDVLQAHGPHCFHVFAQDLAGAFGHVGEENIAQRVGRALERETELVLFDMTQQRLDRAGIEFAQILEREHQRLDALRGIAAPLFQRSEETTFRLAVEIVEDFRHVLV